MRLTTEHTLGTLRAANVMRLDPARRGGDIDVLVPTEAPAFETSQRIATRFFSRCEEKIDVVVMNPARLTAEQTDFLARIRKARIA
ncbi:MAG: hypothetical protein HZA62_02440 [Rhodocyclales bacterium]|nr:hypothetical protein [Rhodocyclales bacterium]MBI5107582.1 hypothetical protein [Rhodocyclales bacterium]